MNLGTEALSLVSRILEREDGNQTSNSTDNGDSNYACCSWIGVTIYIIGAFLMALGVNLQKFSINRESRYKNQRSLFCQPIWVAGIVSYGASGALLSTALAFAPQSQLAPLMSVVIISNALLARFFLHEPITCSDLVSILIIVIAVLLTTLSSPATHESYTTDDLIALYKEPLFVVYIVLLLVTMAFLAWINYYLGKKKKQPNYTLSNTMEKVYAFSFGASAGCWGGLSVTLMKSAITILVHEADDGGAAAFFQAWLFYPILLVLVMCWVFQLSWINAGLVDYPAVFIVSIEAVLNEIVGVCGGILYFQEYAYFSFTEGFIFVLGILIGVYGIGLFATRDNDVSPDKDVFLKCGCRIDPTEVEDKGIEERSNQPRNLSESSETCASDNEEDDGSVKLEKTNCDQFDEDSCSQKNGYVIAIV